MERNVANQNSHHQAQGKPRACTQCRRRKLKCDFMLPSCSRCLSGHLLCSYAPRSDLNNIGGSLLSSNNMPGSFSGDISSDLITPFASVPHPQYDSLSASSRTPPMNSVAYKEIEGGKAKRVVQLYFEHFHPSHPYILPPQYLLERCQSIGSIVLNG
jgi:hypothetical protein